MVNRKDELVGAIIEIIHDDVQRKTLVGLAEECLVIPWDEGHVVKFIVDVAFQFDGNRQWLVRVVNKPSRYIPV